MLRKLLAVALLIALIPADIDPHTGRITTASEPRSFCERNPHTCAAGVELASGMFLKLQALGQFAVNAIRDGAERSLKTTVENEQWRRETSRRFERVVRNGPGGTLRDEDRAPRWNNARSY